MRKTQAYLTNGFGIEFFTVVYRGKEYLFRKLSRMFTDVNDVLYVTEDNCIERRYILDIRYIVAPTSLPGIIIT